MNFYLELSFNECFSVSPCEQFNYTNYSFSTFVQHKKVSKYTIILFFNSFISLRSLSMSLCTHDHNEFGCWLLFLKLVKKGENWEWKVECTFDIWVCVSVWFSRLLCRPLSFRKKWEKNWFFFVTKKWCKVADGSIFLGLNM